VSQLMTAGGRVFQEHLLTYLLTYLLKWLRLVRHVDWVNDLSNDRVEPNTDVAVKGPL